MPTDPTAGTQVERSLRQLVAHAPIASVLWAGDTQGRLAGAIAEAVGPEAASAICGQVTSHIASCSLRSVAEHFTSFASAPNAKLDVTAVVAMVRGLDASVVNHADTKYFLLCAVVHCALQLVLTAADVGDVYSEAQAMLQIRCHPADSEKIVQLRKFGSDLLKRCALVGMEKGLDEMRKVADEFDETCSIAVLIDHLRTIATDVSPAEEQPATPEPVPEQNDVVHLPPPEDPLTVGDKPVAVGDGDVPSTAVVCDNVDEPPVTVAEEEQVESPTVVSSTDVVKRTSSSRRNRKRPRWQNIESKDETVEETDEPAAKRPSNKIVVQENQQVANVPGFDNDATSVVESMDVQVPVANDNDEPAPVPTGLVPPNADYPLNEDGMVVFPADDETSAPVEVIQETNGTENVTESVEMNEEATGPNGLNENTTTRCEVEGEMENVEKEVVVTQVNEQDDDVPLPPNDDELINEDESSFQQNGVQEKVVMNRVENGSASADGVVNGAANGVANDVVNDTVIDQQEGTSASPQASEPHPTVPIGDGVMESEGATTRVSVLPEMNGQPVVVAPEPHATVPNGDGLMENEGTTTRVTVLPEQNGMNGQSAIVAVNANVTISVPVPVLPAIDSGETIPQGDVVQPQTAAMANGIDGNHQQMVAPAVPQLPPRTTARHSYDTVTAGVALVQLLGDKERGTTGIVPPVPTWPEVDPLAPPVVCEAIPNGNGLVGMPRRGGGRVLARMQKEGAKSRPFKCPQCDKSFMQQGHLNRHARSVHAKLRPFVCTQCDKRFTQKGNLEAHIRRIHNMEKPFQCDMCILRFASKDDMRRHKREVHEKERPFKCARCDACFSREQVLEQHVINVHDRLKPWHCKICNHWFGQKSVLTMHIRNVHEKSSGAICAVCDRSFASQATLRRHMNTVHKRQSAPAALQTPVLPEPTLAEQQTQPQPVQCVPVPVPEATG